MYQLRNLTFNEARRIYGPYVDIGLVVFLPRQEPVLVRAANKECVSGNGKIYLDLTRS